MAARLRRHGAKLDQRKAVMTDSLDSSVACIHVGLAKAASTFMQRTVLPPYGFCMAENRKYSSIVNQASEKLYGNPQAALSEEHRFVQELRAPKNDPLLLSSERFCGDPALHMKNAGTRTEVLRRLFPKSRILLVVRRQVDWFESLYVYGVFRGYRGTPSDYVAGKEDIKPPDLANLDGDTHGTNYRCLNYMELYTGYVNAFGASNVFVVPIEALRGAPDMFSDIVGEFLGTDCDLDPTLPVVHRRMSELEYRWRRLFGTAGDSATVRVCRAITRLRFVPARPFPDSLNREILEFHKESNRSFAESIGIDLGRFDYF